MKKVLYFILFIGLSCTSTEKRDQNTIASEETISVDEWIILFDGSSTDHWRAAHSDHFPDSGWYVENRELLNDGSGKGNLVSKDEYSNFILEWEWRLFDEGGNSGLKYFVKENSGKSGNQALGLEYQMLDDERHEWMIKGKMQANDYHTTAALYEFFPPSSEKKMAPLSEFNKSKIVSNGNRVEHWLNGKKVVEYTRGGAEFLEMKSKSKFKDLPDFGLHEEGHLMLQDHQSRVGFKNIRIRIVNK